MKEVEKLLTTKEFADISGVKKDTLIHYDREEIFKPSAVGENGYRYYSLSQVYDFNIVLALKELGMPLAEIKAYMKRQSYYEFLKLLDEQELAIEGKIKRLERMKFFIRQKRSQAKFSAAVETGVVKVEREKDAYIIYTPLAKNENTAKAMTRHCNYMLSLSNLGVYSVGGTIERKNVLGKNYIDYSTLFTEVDEGGGELREGGDYITYYHRGGYESTYIAYELIEEFIAKNGLITEERYYEDSVLGEIAADAKDMIIKIMIKIKT